ncbi:MAG: leucine-rich repeat domain-containing protein [Ruminococcus sp.]|nr:leucine-rich repeat domain-containing protein [Ruminococcus sp.]
MGFKIKKGVLVKYIDDGTKEVIIPYGVKAIGENAFAYCQNITSVEIPDTVREIEFMAFYKCKSLKSVNINYGVVTIGSSSFSDCESLESIKIPDSVKKIKMMAFYRCENLKSVNIPDGITEIHNATFAYCENLHSIVIPDSVTRITINAFEHCKNLVSVNIPDGIEKIEEYSFYRCQSLKSIKIPESVKSIERCAFAYCENLRSIVIPDSVTRIAMGTFEHCKNLVSVNIPDGIEKIEEFTFYRCQSLKSIKIPESVKSIERCAFSYCENLKDITAFADINFDEKSFEDCIFEKITVRDNLSSITVYSKNLYEPYRFMNANPNEKERLLKNSTDGDEIAIVFALYLVFALDNTNAHLYIKKNIVDVVKYLTDVEDTENLTKILSRGYVTSENINKMIKYAIDSRKSEIQLILSNYKNEHLGFADNFDNMMLD